MTHKLLTAKLLAALFLASSSTLWASTTWYVNGVSGSDTNNCTSPTTPCKTIGHAISLASSGDSINVAAATYTENLTIGINLKVIGSGAPTTIIDGGGVARVVTISSGITVRISGLTIRNGLANGGAGILNNGSLLLASSTVRGNKAGNTCGSGKTCTSGGGGILNQGMLTIRSSAIVGNSANTGCIGRCGAYAYGGGIDNVGTMVIINSTIAANGTSASVRAIGGGVSNGYPATLKISNTTISGNGATYGGGDIGNSSLLTIQNSIVANSSSGGNCYGTISSHGYNLSSDGSCNFNKSGDMNNTDPMLGPLQYNGAPTQTMALPSGSPAVDAGNPSGCTDGLGHLLKTDQRGKPRPDTEDTGGCDMGAYERQSD